MMIEVNTTIVVGEYLSFPLPHFHPEFKSRPNRPSPPFKAFLEACINLSLKKKALPKK